jgi:hypothetical protein
MSAKYNLVCEQATTFTFQFQIKTGDTPWDLTNYTAVMTVRPYAGSTTVTAEASTESGRLVIDGTEGRITVTLDTDITTDIAAGRYVYDLVIDSGSVVTRILEGKFVVTAAVTT